MMGLNAWDWINATISILTVIGQLAQVPIAMKAQKVRDNNPQPIKSKQVQQVHYISRKNRR